VVGCQQPVRVVTTDLVWVVGLSRDEPLVALEQLLQDFIGGTPLDFQRCVAGEAAPAGPGRRRIAFAALTRTLGWLNIESAGTEIQKVTG
jgi:hypothetical protein